MSDENGTLRRHSHELDAKWAPHGAFDLDAPPSDALRHLEAINLTDNDIELLFGESPGFSAADIRKDIMGLWFRTRARVTALICDDSKVRELVAVAIVAGSAAVLSTLLSQLGINPESGAAKVLEPLAVGICIDGLNKLCSGTP